MTASTAPSPALRWVLLALTAGVVAFCWPLWPSLVLAAWTAGLTRPLMARFTRRLRGKRRAAAALSLLLFGVLAVPVGLVVVAAVVGAQEVLQLASHAFEQPSPAKSAFEAMSLGPAAPELPRTAPELLELVKRYGAPSVKVFANVAGATARGLLAFFIYFGGSFVLLADGPEAWAWCVRHSPLDGRALERFGQAFHETGRGLLVGVGLTSMTQGLVATVIYLALGIPRWWVLGPITGIASMIPFVGTTLVWAPIAAGLFATGHTVKAIVLIVLGVAVIGSVDNVLRPIFARMGSLRVPMPVLFVSIFGAMSVVGPWGALLGPLVVRLWMEAMAIRREAADGGEQPITTSEAAPAE